MGNISIAGIGNPFRGDDGVGWAVIDALKGRIGQEINLCKSKADIGELIDLFAEYPIIYLVDASVQNGPAGSWIRVDALQEGLPLERPQTSTHGFSISQAISLAKSLDRLPSKLIVYAINGSNYAMSSELSPEVASAVHEVVESLLNEEDVHA